MDWLKNPLGFLKSATDSILNGIVGVLFSQLNALIVSMYTNVLKFLQQVLAVSLVPQLGPFDGMLRNNVTYLAIYIATMVVICMSIFGITNADKRGDWGRSILTFVFIAPLAPLWFRLCDGMQTTGGTWSHASINLFSEANKGASMIAKFLPPDPISGALGFGFAGFFGFLISVVAFMFPVIFLFTKYTGLIFFCLRVTTTRAQGAWDWVFGLLIISTLLGRVVIILFLDIGILNVKYGPGGAWAFGGMFYAISSEVAALYAVYKLIRNAPRISSRLTGGAVRTISQVTGAVVSTVKDTLKVNPAGGFKAHANSMKPMPVRAVSGNGNNTTSNPDLSKKYGRQARRTRAATTGAAAAASTLAPPAAPYITAAGGLLAGRLEEKRRASA